MSLVKYYHQFYFNFLNFTFFILCFQLRCDFWNISVSGWLILSGVHHSLVSWNGERDRSSNKGKIQICRLSQQEVKTRICCNLSWSKSPSWEWLQAWKALQKVASNEESKRLMITLNVIWLNPNPSLWRPVEYKSPSSSSSEMSE